MELVEETDAHALLAEAQPLFAPREVENNLPLGVLKMVSQGLYRGVAPWLWSVRDGAQLIGMAIRTPPFPLVLSDLPDAACAVLAEGILARTSFPLPLNGPRDVVDRVTDQLVQRSAVKVELLYNMRLFELRQVTPPPPTAGAMRRATAADAPVLTQFMDGFERESLPEQVGTRDLRTVIDNMIAQGRGFLWQDGEQAGAMAAFNRRVGAGTSIGAVYTPPALRKRGYATALVAALSQHMLDDGCAYTCLFTNLANPISNSIYPKVGYRAVCDTRHVRVLAAS
jgi:predicted GNAT family acetyltransferase